MQRPDEILEFWFGPPGSAKHKADWRRWFVGSAALDAEISRRFLADYERAAVGGCDAWLDAPLPCLALILLLDQFPRNMFRGAARSFATDAKAIDCAREAIARDHTSSLDLVERFFCYMAFELSEDMEDQRLCVSLMRSLEAHPKCRFWVENAIEHHDIVARFGRFPHRNAILGRPNTPEEEAFLADTSERFGTVPHAPAGG